MGSTTGHIWLACGTRFSVRQGGGFYFDLLHCDACGKDTSVAHQDLGDIHLRYVKGLPGPYAVARAAMDRRILEMEQIRGLPHFPSPWIT
jgi:hypothetical protein